MKREIEQNCNVLSIRKSDEVDKNISTEPIQSSYGKLSSEQLCQPGTPVNLAGTVWYENDKGLLVVNIEWRGKTYFGTLMDSSIRKNDNSFERFNTAKQDIMIENKSEIKQDNNMDISVDINAETE